MGKMFGGTSNATSQSSSSDVNNGMLKDSLKSTVDSTGTSNNALQQMLGLVSGGMSPTQTYEATPGYDFMKQQGLQAINDDQAAKGLIGSGSTLKAIDKFGTGLADSTSQQYIQNLLGLGQQGLGAAGVLADSGKVANASSDSSSGGKNGMGWSILGNVGKAVALSERHMKEDIIELYRMSDGLGVYEFKYKTGPARFIGTMVDEVEQLRPWALGPVINGMKTVDYSKLGGE